nr:MAG TPA: hypothetical protein [Caudoviricetes sp.]
MLVCSKSLSSYFNAPEIALRNLPIARYGL